jgi:hypothetical protein
LGEPLWFVPASGTFAMFGVPSPLALLPVTPLDAVELHPVLFAAVPEVDG